MAAAVSMALTLVVAVKPDCDGCRDFVEGNLDDLSNVDVIVVTAAAPRRVARRTSRGSGLSGDVEELQIRSAPFYVLIDASRQLCGR